MSRNYDDFKKTTCITKIKDIKDGYYSFVDTAFWGEKGGMPSDCGTINGKKVLDLKWDDETLYHKVDGELENPIIMEVDQKTRWVNTALQTTFHCLDSYYENKGLEIIAIGTNHNNFWYEVNIKDIPDSHLEEVEEYMLNIIREAHPVNFSYISGKDYPDSKYQKYREVRIVDINGVNKQPCGTLHVNNTSEIANFTILSKENTSRGTKIYVSCNTDANCLLHNYFYILNNLSHELKINKNDLIENVKSLVNTNKNLKKQLADTKRELACYKVKDLVGLDEIAVEITDIEEMRIIAQELMNLTSTTKVLYNVTDNIINFVILSPSNKAKEIFGSIQDKLNAKGGGSPKIVNGQTNGDKELFLNIINSSIVSC